MIKHIHVRECDSTQDLLKEQLGQIKDSPEILVSCEHQIKGRGRGDHTWQSLPGSLCFSLSIQPHAIPSFTAIEMSVLVAKFFEGSVLHLKWPNDILNKNRKKCCGVLVQTYKDTMIAGLGINLFSDHPDYGGVFDFSFDFDKNSWSLELANYILNNRFKENEELIREWEVRCMHLNTPVAITEGEIKINGLFTGLGNYGEAVLDTYQGEKHVFNGSLTLI